MDLSQHAAYLKGLAEGKGLTEDAEKGDFVKALLACINDMAEEIESLEEASALRDISHMPARVKCAVLGWRTLKEAWQCLGD